MNTPPTRRHRESPFAALARRAAHWSATSTAFAVAVGIVGVWLISGPFFGFSDTWLLAMNTGTTITTFLMVFLVQRAQAKDAKAIHLKLNEIVAALHGASNRLINVEDLTEEEVHGLHDHYGNLLKRTEDAGHKTHSHSVEETAAGHPPPDGR